LNVLAPVPSRWAGTLGAGTDLKADDRAARAPGRTIVPVVLVGGLVLYFLAKAVAWAYDAPRVVDLITKADHDIYMRQAERVLSGGPLYQAWQLAGPYASAQLPELYPPPTVYGLFVPLSLLPDPVWWILPIAVIVSTVAYWRPSPWGWVGIMACLAVPHTWTSIAAGNPAMWAAAGLALGTRFGWPAILALLKPTLAPFALVGSRTRGWWAAAAVLSVTTVVLLPAWLDYVTVVRNFGDSSLLYSVGNVPLMAIPLIAHICRSGAKRPVQSER